MGFELITALQEFRSPPLDAFFQAVTVLGQEDLFLLLVPLLLWCVDFGLGARLAFLYIISTCVYVDLKDLLQQPRPFVFDPSVQLVAADGYSLPSGHSQSAVVMWGALALWWGKRWAWVAAIVVAGLVGLSRVYLGVHFPVDVLAGWAIGVAFLAFYARVGADLWAGLAKVGLGTQVLLALGIPLSLLTMNPTEDIASATGTLAGLGLGLALGRRYASFSPLAPARQVALRLLVGFAVIVVLYAGLKTIFPAGEADPYLAFRFLRYGLIGLWASLGVPWLFGTRSKRTATAAA
ncbi:MAG: phosphatase PAP2 family protein [Chloroflexota bacterium]